MTEYALYGWDELAPVKPWSVLGWGYARDKSYALRLYAKLGLHPILLYGLFSDLRCTCGRPDCDRSRGKHPLHNSWQTEPLNVDYLLAELDRQPLLNIGLKCGAQPNGRFLVVVDVDGPLSLLDEYSPTEPFPPTLTARTGSGGTHLFYYLPPGEHWGNRAGLLGKRERGQGNIDIRGEGGQVVAAPSLHYSGNQYRFVDCREPVVLP